MSEHAIKVIKIGKEYKIGERIKYNTLRESITSLASKFISGLKGGKFREESSPDSNLGTNPPSNGSELGTSSHSKPNYIWSLKDVTFDVKRGEIIGIIGNNGAGKSTLLKLISGVTEPTEGRIDIYGRIGSLLEVGTGFHPELTGRENIFLNGAILGMKKREIEKKYDEIVDFSGVEDFIDTPIKFYSSGMRVRLGFSVAAHLDPDILLLDEVLAVGDARFQQKCLGKLNEVASSEGRTVIFVTHDMAAILSLCGRVVLLEDGRLKAIGDTKQVVDQYLKSVSEVEDVSIEKRGDIDKNCDGSVRATFIQIDNMESGKPIRPTSRIKIKVGYRSDKPVRNLIVFIFIKDINTGQTLTILDSDNSGGIPETLPTEGTITCTTDKIFITSGRCVVDLTFLNGTQKVYHLANAEYFTVEEEIVYGIENIPRSECFFVLEHKWSIEE